MQTELDRFFQVLHQLPIEQPSVTPQALSLARRKLKPSVFEALNQALQQQLDALGLRRTWRGLRLLAIDGSTVHLPLESGLERFFGQHHELPMARLSMLYDVLNEQALHSLLVPLDVGERGCAQLHLDQAPPHSLILFDRGYPAQWLFALLQQQACQFVMRLPTGYNPEVEAFLQSGQAERDVAFQARHWDSRLACNEVGVDAKARIRLRLVRVELPTGEVEVLATSLLDADRFPTTEFKDLYHRRWGIETDYRRQKQTLRLENFSGRTVTAVKQDMLATQLLRNLALLMMHLEQPRIAREQAHRKLRWKVNVTQGVSRLKDTLVQLFVRPGIDLMAALLALLRRSLSAIRPGRRFPRKRRRQATRGCEGYKRTR